MSSSKIETYNKYNVVHDGEKVDVANWAKKYGMEVNVEDELQDQRLYLGDNVVVAVSPGYGSGWSSWNRFTAVDPVINLMVYTLVKSSRFNEDNVKELYGAIREDFSDYRDYICVFDNMDIEIEYIHKDTRFKVTEYDGYERIEYRHESEWL